MKGFPALLFVFLVLFSAGSGRQPFEGIVFHDKIVGTDLPFEDITDFYYTYDSSAVMPDYQRYRFYTEDGRRFFAHETRQGQNWPQTEEDITRSGTVALTDAQWAEFCDLIGGGTASRRKESLVDGDAGPWMYIYWQGGEAAGREYAFAQAGSLLAFEAFCEALADQTGDHTLTRFSYTIWGYIIPESWEITLGMDGYRIQENEEPPRPFPHALAEELTRVIEENSADTWNGVYETEYLVLDGEAFRLEMDFADGLHVFASGENAFPDKYFPFKHAVMEIFEQSKTAHPAK